MARAREAHRKAKGCVDISNMECNVRVAGLDTAASEADLDIAVHVIAAHESPSRQMVKEAMVLAGEIAALWGAQHHVPLLYRCPCAALQCPALRLQLGTTDMRLPGCLELYAWMEVPAASAILRCADRRKRRCPLRRRS